MLAMLVAMTWALFPSLAFCALICGDAGAQRQGQQGQRGSVAGAVSAHLHSAPHEVEGQLAMQSLMGGWLSGRAAPARANHGQNPS